VTTAIAVAILHKIGVVSVSIRNSIPKTTSGTASAYVPVEGSWGIVNPTYTTTSTTNTTSFAYAIVEGTGN